MTTRVEHLTTKVGPALTITAKSQILSQGFRYGGMRTEYRVTLGDVWIGSIRKDVYQPRTKEWVVFLHDLVVPAAYEGTLSSAMTRLAHLHLDHLRKEIR